MKEWLRKKLWSWLRCEQEVNRRVREMSDYLADQHKQKVQEERATLTGLIRQLVRVTAQYIPHTGVLSYTTTISERLLLESLNDRQAMRAYLADEIAYHLMTVRPIKR